MADINLQPMGDRIIVEPVQEEEATASGIILPESAKEKPQRGTILAVGPGGRDDDGDRIAMDVAVGDLVLFSKYAGSGSNFKTDDGREVLILKESDLLAKITG